MAYRIFSHKAARRRNKAASSRPYGSNALKHNKKKALNKGLLFYAYPKIYGNSGREKDKRRGAVVEVSKIGFAVVG